MDVSYWGPSGWQLLHLITFDKGRLETKKKLLTAMKDILPCKYCRLSANEFIKESPVDNNPAFWLYKFHDKVNQKLEKQHEEDPKVRKPIPSPSFDNVVGTYTTLLKNKPTTAPGRDFLFSIAYNYDPEHRAYHQKFWEHLIKVYPFFKFDKIPEFTTNQSYLQDVHTMISKMVPTPSLQSTRQQLAYYKSGCKKKSYKGKTCKKIGGGYTKRRDYRKTYRVTHSRLLF